MGNKNTSHKRMNDNLNQSDYTRRQSHQLN